MVKEARFKLWWRKSDEKRDYLLAETKHDNLLSEKHNKTGKYWNYVENVLILWSAVAGCVSISAFVSFVYVPVEATSSVVGINICATTAGSKKYKSIIKKKKTNHNKIVLSGKDNVNAIEVPFSKDLIESRISHDEFVAVNNILR